jgi:hypothetical protein
MITKPVKNRELDQLLKNALASSLELEFPTDLRDKTIRRLQKRAILRELLLELSYKAGLVIGSLGILAGVLIWTNGYDILVRFFSHLSEVMIIIIPLLFVAIFTVLIDQIVIRFYDQYKKPGQAPMIS